MSATTLARRYAGALFGIAEKANIVDKAQSDLKLITSSLCAMPDLRQTVMHPLVPPVQKRSIIDKVYTGKIDDITLRFLYLLLDKRREGIIEEIEKEFISLANSSRGIVTAKVLSAVPLLKKEEAALTSKLSACTGKTVQLELSVDPSLIGGLTVCIGNNVIDGSIKGHLASLKNKMLGRD
ncbi:MAG: F0F1 ATP synthase subunit delta [Armatimonadota bacterium]|jgi:F-type H+-transporting ATPase subunit delta